MELYHLQLCISIMWPIALKRNVPMAVQNGRGKRHPRFGGTMTEQEAFMFIRYMTGKEPIRALKYFYESNDKLYSAMYPISKPGRFVEGAVHHLTGQIGVEKCGFHATRDLNHMSAFAPRLNVVVHEVILGDYVRNNKVISARYMYVGPRWSGGHVRCDNGWTVTSGGIGTWE